MRLLEPIAGTLGARVFIIVIGVLTSIVTARALGPEGRGILVTVTAAVQVAMQVGNGGIPSANTYLAASRPALVPGLVANSLLAPLAFGILVALAGLLLWPLVGVEGASGAYLAVMILWSSALYAQTLFSHVLLGSRRFTLFNALELCGKAAALLVAFLALAIFKVGLVWFMVCLLSLDIFFAALAFGFLTQGGGGMPRPTLSVWWHCLAVGWRAYLCTFLPPLVIRSDILLLNLFRGPAETGVYSIAAQIVDYATLLPATVGMVLFPILSASGESKSNRTTLAASRFTILPLLATLAGLALLGQSLVRLLYGRAFVDAYVPLLVLLPGAFALGVEIVFVQHFNAQGYPLWIPLVWAGAVAMKLVSSAFLLPAYGMFGAALTTSAIHLLVSGVVLFVFLKDSRVTIWQFWTILWPLYDVPAAVKEVVHRKGPTV